MYKLMGLTARLTTTIYRIPLKWGPRKFLIFGESGGHEDFNDDLSSVRVQVCRTRGGLAQLARAPALQAGGQRFESVILHGFVLGSNERK